MPKKTNDRNQVSEIISKRTEQYFSDLKNNTKFIFEFNNYVQEEARYGGSVLMNIAEKQFHRSSKSVINLISSNYNLWNYSLAVSFAIQMHLCLSKSLFISKEDEIFFYKRFYETWLFYSKGIDCKVENVETSKINKLLQSFESSYEKQKSKIEKLIEFIETKQEDGWQTQWKADCSEIASLYETHIPNDKYLVYSSLIHMTNNRLGIHISDESFIAFLIFRGLERKV